MTDEQITLLNFLDRQRQAELQPYLDRLRADPEFREQERVKFEALTKNFGQVFASPIALYLLAWEDAMTRSGQWLKEHKENHD